MYCTGSAEIIKGQREITWSMASPGGPLTWSNLALQVVTVTERCQLTRLENATHQRAVPGESIIRRRSIAGDHLGEISLHVPDRNP